MFLAATSISLSTALSASLLLSLVSVYRSLSPIYPIFCAYFCLSLHSPQNTCPVLQCVAHVSLPFSGSPFPVRRDTKQGTTWQPVVPTQVLVRGWEVSSPSRQRCFLSRINSPLAGLEHPLDCAWEGDKYKSGRAT